MILAKALYEVRLNQQAYYAKLQCEMAMIQAMKEGTEFTVIGFTHEGKILTHFAGHWIEV